MRRIGLLVTQHCPPRDDTCELQAIFDFIVRNVRYTGDITGKDTFQSALRTLQMGGGDCLPGDTLLQVRERGLVPLRHVEPGWEIWGLERWSKVEAVWSKGVLPVDLIVLDTGATFKATRDHHVYRFANPQFVDLDRVLLSDLRPGDLLPVPRPYAIPGVQVPVAAVRVFGRHENVAKVETFDLTTDDHRVFLPEANVTVSQCDDHSVSAAVLAMENGFRVKWRITSNRGDTWDHIYGMAGVPKHSPSRWVALDTTLGSGKFGREPPRAKFKDFPVSTEEE
jgi:hypothetical protein